MQRYKTGPCPDCTEGHRDGCPTCEGCGEVWYPNAEQAKYMQDRLDGLIPPGCGTLTKEQIEGFIAAAIRAPRCVVRKGE